MMGVQVGRDAYAVFNMQCNADESLSQTDGG